MPKATQHASEAKSDLIELVGMVKAYALQETVRPLKTIGRTLAFGLAAAVCFGVASVLALVALLRALQGETGTVFAGEWSWVPYLLTVVGAVVGLGIGAALTLRSGSESR